MAASDRPQTVSGFYVALTLLDLLLDPFRSRITLQELADETGRSPRTIRRYLAVLERLGLHWDAASPARGTGIARRLKQTLHLLNFTEEELAALYFHLHLAHDMVREGPLGVVRDRPGRNRSATIPLPRLGKACVAPC